MNTTEEWHADIQITEELVRDCLQAQFSFLTPIKEIRHLGEGWDNKVFLINGKTIFRFPRRKVAVELMERENKVLNNLSTFATVNIPIPKYTGHPTARYPYPFQGYDMIKGISAYQAQLSAQDRLASLATLSGFLKQLHSTDEVNARAIGAKPQVFDRTVINKIITALNERIVKIIARKICNVKADCFQEEIAIVQKLTLPYDDKCLVHGDLDCRHLIFNKSQLTGIIDWGDVGINNKSVDLAVVWGFYPSSCHPQFLKIYGAVDSATWQYARFLGLYSAFTLMLYGADIGDALLVAESTSAIKRINTNLLIDHGSTF